MMCRAFLIVKQYDRKMQISVNHVSISRGPIFFLENVNLEKAESINVEHTAIAEAIAARDADLAEELIRTHIETRREQISILR